MWQGPWGERKLPEFSPAANGELWQGLEQGAGVVKARRLGSPPHLHAGDRPGGVRLEAGRPGRSWRWGLSFLVSGVRGHLVLEAWREEGLSAECEDRGVGVKFLMSEGGGFLWRLGRGDSLPGRVCDDFMGVRYRIICPKCTSIFYALSA